MEETKKLNFKLHNGEIWNKILLNIRGHSINILTYIDTRETSGLIVCRSNWISLIRFTIVKDVPRRKIWYFLAGYFTNGVKF